MNIRATLDTNVLVAGLRSSAGASHRLLGLIGTQKFELLVSVPLFFEYEDVLGRATTWGKTPPLSQSDRTALLDYWALVCRPVKLHFLWRPMLTDPADDMVLETAVNGGGDFLVTFNLRDFAQAGNLFELQVVTPADFLKILEG